MCIFHLGQTGPSKIKFCTNTHYYYCSLNVQGRRYFSMLHLRNLKLREVTHLKSLLPLPVCQTKCHPTSWPSTNALLCEALSSTCTLMDGQTHTHTQRNSRHVRCNVSFYYTLPIRFNTLWHIQLARALTLSTFTNCKWNFYETKTLYFSVWICPSA